MRWKAKEEWQKVVENSYKRENNEIDVKLYSSSEIDLVICWNPEGEWHNVYSKKLKDRTAICCGLWTVRKNWINVTAGKFVWLKYWRYGE